MAYLGTPPRSRVLSSADIGTGAVTLDDISFTDQPTSVNVSGAINKHTMRLSDQVVIDGDLTITDNLILSKISDDGNAITLTNDSSTRTITGTGSLEASTLTQTPNASLTGMTGELGSVVTGSPALNLSDTTQFPAGHIIQVQALSSNTRSTTGSNTWNSKWSKTLAITPKKASSNIWLSASFTTYVNHHSAYFDFYKNASDVTETYNLSGLTYGCADIQTGVNWLGMTITFLDTCTENSTSEKTYSFSGRHSNTGGTLYLGGGDNAGVTLTLMEIAT